jgi:two-component system phosphate regulon sensor histidine kinase PhoR
MDYLLVSLFSAGVVALAWYLSARGARRQRDSLEQVLETFARGETTPSLDFLHSGSLSTLSVPVEHVSAELSKLRRDMRDEAYNLKTILESMEEGVMVVDSRHVLRLVNPSFLRLFHFERSPLGLTVLHALRETTVAEMITRALRTGEGQSCDFSRISEKPLQHYAAHAVPMQDTTGRLNALVIFRDVSRLKQLEEVRREFVANVSHELRTPLSIFHGYVETLLDAPDIDRDDLAGILQILKRHSARLNAILEDLLILARLESRHERLRLEPVDMGAFCTTLVQDWSAKVAAKNVTLTATVQPSLPDMPADPLRLDQVFSNLLDNALKYTPSGGRITIDVQKEGENFNVAIQDTGAGIPPADVAHIFERFYRADKARTREQGGTGLGLSIVKHIVQSHGGTVRAESVHGKGTTVILTFPAAPADSESASAAVVDLPTADFA